MCEIRTREFSTSQTWRGGLTPQTPLIIKKKNHPLLSFVVDKLYTLSPFNGFLFSLLRLLSLHDPTTVNFCRLYSRVGASRETTLNVRFVGTGDDPVVGLLSFWISHILLHVASVDSVAKINRVINGVNHNAYRNKSINNN